MARLIINPLSNYEMVKSNEISGSRFLMSVLPILLILCLPAPQTITSAYVMLLQAYTTHEYESFWCVVVGAAAVAAAAAHTSFLLLTGVREKEIMSLFQSVSQALNAFGFFLKLYWATLRSGTN